MCIARVLLDVTMSYFDELKSNYAALDLFSELIICWLSSVKFSMPLSLRERM